MTKPMNDINVKEMRDGKNIVLSFQHLLAMYAGAIVVPIIIAGALNYTPEQTAYIVAADIVICAIATFLQVYKGKYIGIGLPVVMATAFTGVGPIIQAGTEHSPAVAYGSVFAAGIIMLLLAPIFAKLNRLFPTLVTGIVVRSEEHTSELQSRGHLVCRLLLEKKKYEPTQIFDV